MEDNYNPGTGPKSYDTHALSRDHKAFTEAEIGKDTALPGDEPGPSCVGWLSLGKKVLHIEGSFSCGQMGASTGQVWDWLSQQFSMDSSMRSIKSGKRYNGESAMCTGLEGLIKPGSYEIKE